MRVVVPGLRIPRGMPVIAIAIGLLASAGRSASCRARRPRPRVRRSLSHGRSQHPGPRRRILERGGYAVRPIDGLSLDVAAGSLVILLGPSGCGKTNAAVLPRRHPASESRRHQVRRRQRHGARLAGGTGRRTSTTPFSMVSQAFNLVPSLTAMENVMVPMRAAGMTSAVPHISAPRNC